MNMILIFTPNNSVIIVRELISAIKTAEINRSVQMFNNDEKTLCLMCPVAMKQADGNISLLSLIRSNTG